MDSAFLFYFLLVALFSSSLVLGCDPCLNKSKASLFSNVSSITSGSCGYGGLATSFYNGHLASVIPSLYNDGAGCGACYKVICTNTKLCSKTGTEVIVTDLRNNNQTDFSLTNTAFMSMAKKGMEQALLKLGTVDFEYKRVPCVYKKKNFSVRIDESSRKPSYLAMQLLYQGGQTDIVAIDVAKTGDLAWHFMSRKYGAIWETNRVPAGGMQFHFIVTGDYDGKYVWAKNVIPADWKIGGVYDSGLQITQMQPNACFGCV